MSLEIDVILNKYFSVEPKVRDVLEGASDAYIHRFEEVCGCKFPDEYKSFLTRMGKNDGGILDLLPAFTNVESLILSYDEADEFPDEVPPKGWFTIAVGHAGVCLIMNQSSGVIHESSYGDVDDYYAEGILDVVRAKADARYFGGSSGLRW